MKQAPPNEKTVNPFPMPPKNHWYVACWSHELKKQKVIGKTIYGERIVLFRDENGSPAALQDRCPHRLVPLSKGWLKDNTLTCPYHGWGFSSEGECVSVPGLLKEKKLPCAKVKKYACIEQEGFVWVYPIHSENPSFLPPSLLPDTEHYRNIEMEASVRGEMIFALENFLDSTHTHFVHGGVIRGAKERKVVDVQVIRDNFTVSASYSPEVTGKGVINQVLAFGNKEISGIGRFINPSVAQLEFTTDRGWKMFITVPYTPTESDKIETKVLISYKAPIPKALASSIIKPLFKYILHINIVEA